MSVVPFPALRPMPSGTIHVWGDSVDGFSVSHESSSGDSWGEVHGPFDRGERAIVFAYTLNRDSYGGGCAVLACDAAVQDACPNVGLVSVPGDF